MVSKPMPMVSSLTVPLPPSWLEVLKRLRRCFAGRRRSGLFVVLATGLVARTVP